MRWIAAAIVAAGFLIAASIAITSHYSIVPLTPLVGVSRLDHWTSEASRRSARASLPNLRTRIFGVNAQLHLCQICQTNCSF
jgi:hypothetical protein